MDSQLLPIEPPIGLEEVDTLAADIVGRAGDSITATAMGLLNERAHIFFIAFVVTLFLTPLVRRLAIAFDMIDHPDALRKMHDYPVAYLGGVAVLMGLIAAIGFSYAWPVESAGVGVPLAVVLGMMVITFTGLIDDASGLFPRLKIAGQLVAAAALAINDIGVHVAEGLLVPIIGQPNEVIVTILDMPVLNSHLIYWVGTATIAIFVLGGCNAANLIDGLDGLLAGVVAIVAVGLLSISVVMTIEDGSTGAIGGLGDARLVLCLALLGAVLGFLPHNFNPASIFLGDSGSLLLGYVSVTIILMLGDAGQTQFVFAGLIVFALPIIDTTLAIIRRKLAGTSMSAADHQHLHHQLKRTLGGVRKAVLALYGISAMFAVIGVTLAALVVQTSLRVRVIYVIAFVLFGFIGTIAVKVARLQQIRTDLQSTRAASATGSVAPKPASRPKATAEEPQKKAATKRDRPTGSPQHQ